MRPRPGCLYVHGVTGLLQSLWGGGPPRQAGPLLDVILMVALTDGPLDAAEWDGLAWVLGEEPLLAGVSFRQALARARALAGDAPLFADARDELAQTLDDPELRQRSVVLAAAIAGALRPLDEDEHALLNALARGFGLSEATLAALLRRADEQRPKGHLWARSPFNDPLRPRPNLAELLAQTRDDRGLRQAAFKLAAVRSLMTKLSDHAEVARTGEPLETARGAWITDATVLAEGRQYWVRCLAPGEALHPAEHELLETLLPLLPAEEGVLLVSTSELSRPDRELVGALAPLLGLERVEI